MVNGSVTISIEDYHSFVDSAIKMQEIKDKFTTASKELQVLLSFLAARENLEKYIEEFNRQSKTSKIVFEGTSARIELKNDKENIKEI
jgi:hypothetical protein